MVEQGEGLCDSVVSISSLPGTRVMGDGAEKVLDGRGGDTNSGELERARWAGKHLSWVLKDE